MKRDKIDHLDQYFMDKAIDEAYKAFDKDEVPIGAILVDDNGVIISRGYNQIEKKESQLAHAEIIVLTKALKKIKNWRLLSTTLYVTVQPCMMCLGALYLSRVSRVVYGAISYKFGMSFDTAQTGGIYKNLSMQLEYMENKKAEEVLSMFFRKKRSIDNDKKYGSGENKKRFIDS